jgi:hypothetical protein
MALVTTPDHGYVVLSTAAICFFGAAAGGLYVGGARSKAFGKVRACFALAIFLTHLLPPLTLVKAWAESKAAKELQDEHKKEIGTDFPKNGYRALCEAAPAAASRPS